MILIVGSVCVTQGDFTKPEFEHGILASHTPLLLRYLGFTIWQWVHGPAAPQGLVNSC